MAGCTTTRRQFSKASHESGLLEYEFDYLGFDHKVNKGNWPHPYASYMKVLGKDYDLKSELHNTNKAAMDEYNRELFDIVEQTMYLPQKEEDKIERRGKTSSRDRIRALMDRGSPFLAIG